MNISSPKRLASRTDPSRPGQIHLSASTFLSLSRKAHLASRDCCTSKQKIFLEQNVDFSEVSPSFHSNSRQFTSTVPRVPPNVPSPPPRLARGWLMEPLALRGVALVQSAGR